MTKLNGSKPKSSSIETVASAVIEAQIPLEKQIKLLEAELSKKDKEIAKLKEALANSVSPSGYVLPVSDEAEIASIQLNKLKILSRERALTFDEIKILDLLVKTKRLAEGDVTSIQGMKTIRGKDDLLKLVSPPKKDKKDVNKS